jgi:hypothetical protein
MNSGVPGGKMKRLRIVLPHGVRRTAWISGASWRPLSLSAAVAQTTVS